MSGNRTVALVVSAAAAVAATAGAVWWSAIRPSNPHGPLFSRQMSADSGMPLRPEPTDIGDITFGNDGKRAAVISSIKPVSPTAGLIVTFRLVETADPTLGVGYGRVTLSGLRPPAGFVVQPTGTREPIEVIASLHPLNYVPGRYTSLGLDIHYTVAGHAYTLFVDEGLTTCYRVPVCRCGRRVNTGPSAPVEM